MGVPGNANALLLRSAAAAGGYQVSRSIRLNSADSAHLSRTPASAGNRKTWTWSGWIKRASFGTTQAIFGARDGGSYSLFFFYSGDNIGFNYGGTLPTTTEVYRDPSAWYHMVFVLDTTQSTQANRLKIYVNGTQQTLSSNGLTQDQETEINVSSRTHVIAQNPSDVDYFNGYLTDIHFIDGQALTPSSFAETDATTGQWIPKLYTGSYGTNGFQLKFADNSNNTATTLGKDTSGNGNNFTPNNLSVTAGAGNDSLVDTPTSYGTDTGAGGEVRGNCATWNPLNKGSNATLTNGNLDFSSSTAYSSAFSTIGVTSGKWYFETTAGAFGNDFVLGLSKDLAGGTYVGGTAQSWGYEAAVGAKYNNTSYSATGYSTYTTNDVISVAFDADNGKLYFAKNGVWQESGNPATGANPAYTGLTSGPYFFGCSAGVSGTWLGANFGQRPFAYTAPSGFKALVDTNLPAPVVAQPSTVMDVALWQGDGATTRTITLAGGMSPDFVWIKNRAYVYDHILFDSVRGTEKALKSNATAAESTLTNSITAFGTGSFTLGKDNSGEWNFGSAHTYVGWAWDAGSSTVTNTQGSITSQVRANASAGFSIVTISSATGSAGATIGHGLGVTPALIIQKARTTTYSWNTYFNNNGTWIYLVLNDTSASSATTTSNMGTTPSSTTIGLGGNFSGSHDYVYYCFAPVTGYSSFGSYTGTSAAQFVYLGFRPKFWMHKVSNSVGSWMMLDSSRDPYNVVGQQVYANLSNAESTYSGGALDFVSNGVVLRSTNNDVNGSGYTYIYAAFAENPFQYARAR